MVRDVRDTRNYERVKKVLIISYFYPPCNLTAAQRVGSFHTELCAKGFEVTTITRKWEEQVTDLIPMHKATSSGISEEQSAGGKVIRVPYVSNRRDELLVRGRKPWLRKLLSFQEAVFQNVYPKLCPFYALYAAADKEMKTNSYDLVMVSGNPFIQFQFGYALAKKYDVKWIADYRDAWTTSTINHIGRSPFYRIYQLWDRYFERKWVGTASYITASSDEIGREVSALCGVPHSTLFNGYDRHLFDGLLEEEKRKDVFQIAYIGTLYQGQRIELFLTAYKKFIDLHHPKVKLLFPGLALDQKQAQRVTNALDGYADCFQITPRVPQEDILKIEKESHVLLHIAWQGHKGIVASKIYEYIGSGTRILVCPGDASSIDEIMRISQAGESIETVDEVVNFLEQEYNSWRAGTSNNPRTSETKHLFTRQGQAEKLADLINTLLP